MAKYRYAYMKNLVMDNHVKYLYRRICLLVNGFVFSLLVCVLFLSINHYLLIKKMSYVNTVYKSNVMQHLALMQKQNSLEQVKEAIHLYNLKVNTIKWLGLFLNNTVMQHSVDNSYQIQIFPQQNKISAQWQMLVQMYLKKEMQIIYKRMFEHINVIDMKQIDNGSVKVVLNGNATITN